MLVDLVGYDRNVVLGGYVEYIEQVLAAEHRAAGIGGIVNEHGRRVFVDLRLQVVQIDFPAELRLNR